MNKIITAQQWQALMSENMFYKDLKSIVQAVDVGIGKKRFINAWLKKNGYRLNWKTLDLTILKTGKTK